MKLYPRPQGTAYLLRDLLRSTLVKSVAYKYLSEYCGHRAVVVSTVARTQARASYWPPIEKCDGDRALRPLRRKNEVFDSGCAPVPVLTLAYRGGPGLPRISAFIGSGVGTKIFRKLVCFARDLPLGL